MTDTAHTGCVIQPSYYHDFHCLAADCPDTCCKGWIIEIDPPTYEKWKEHDCIPEQYITSTPLRNGQVRHQICMNEKQECPMLTPEGLCSLVIEHGHPMTTQICRDYPRQENEYENLLQRSVSVRCAAVLELLWAEDHFHYIVSDEDTCTYPARHLLDEFLAMGNQTELTTAAFLSAMFDALFLVHKQLEAEIPCDESGLRDYGVEFLTEENTAQVLEFFSLFAANTFSMQPAEHISCPSSNFHTAPVSSSAPAFDSVFESDLFHACHSMMYDVMQSFFDSPVFGPDFHDLFAFSSERTANMPPEYLSGYAAEDFLTPEMDRKLKLLIQEQLFTSVLSVEVLDYESILVRLQWLMVQYLVLRHMLFLDHIRGLAIDDAHLMFRITRLFRVTELPDILKISFFDSGFKNWLWTPDVWGRLLRTK